MTTFHARETDIGEQLLVVLLRILSWKTGKSPCHSSVQDRHESTRGRRSENLQILCAVRHFGDLFMLNLFLPGQQLGEYLFRTPKNTPLRGKIDSVSKKEKNDLRCKDDGNVSTNHIHGYMWLLGELGCELSYLKTSVYRMRWRKAEFR